MSEYVSKTDVLNLPQSIERNLCGEIVERSIDVKDIESLEPADVVPVVHGKWTKLFYDGFNCNKCGSTFVIMQGRNNMYYCPNCGAKMDGGENG